MTQKPDNDNIESGGQQLDPPDYSRVFKKSSRRERAGTGNRSGFSRFRAAARGTGGFLGFALIGILFVSIGVGMAASSIWRATTWQAVTARVVSLEGLDEQHDRATLKYEYQVAGHVYPGSQSAQPKEYAYKPLQALKNKTTFTAYYCPSSPEQSQLTNVPNVQPMGFAIFALPFAAFGLISLVRHFQGRDIQMKTTSGGAQVLGGFWLLSLFLISAVGAIVFLILADKMSWPLGLAVSLAIPAFAICVSALIARKERANDAQEGTIPKYGEYSNSMTLPPLGRRMAFAVVVTLFACGIVGVLAGFVGYSFWKAYRANTSYQSTRGEVLWSRVAVEHGSKSTTEKPIVKYSYAVAGKPYFSDQYAYGMLSTNIGSDAEKVVANHPAGKQMTVFYDPANPSEAVLSRDIPSVMFVMVLFIQPFLLFALFLLGYTVTIPFTYFRFKRFVESPPAIPDEIPGWGVVQEGPGARRIVSVNRWATVAGFMWGFGIASLLCAFACVPVVIVGGVLGTSVAPAAAALLAVAVFAGIGWAAVCAFRRRHAARVVLDLAQKTLRVESHENPVEIPFADIERWGLADVHYPGDIAVNGQTIELVLLTAYRRSGGQVPLHAYKYSAFQGNSGMWEVVHKTLDVLSRATGSTYTTRVKHKKDGSSGSTPNPLSILRALLRRGQYQDLR